MPHPRPRPFRRYAPLLVALAVSILLHLSLLGPRWMLAPRLTTEPQILRAQLERLAPSLPAPTRASRAEGGGKKPPARAGKSPAAPAARAPGRGASTPLPQERDADTKPRPPPIAAAAEQPPSGKLNGVPARLQIVYRIRYGPVTGQQVLEWVVDKGHYTLSTVVRATGLAGLFYRGRIVQISRGAIGPQGLTPHEFWDERGDYYAQARFDYASREVMLQSNRGLRRYPISANIQDALSLLLQIALTAPPPATARVELFNSKKVRHYLIRALGEETLDTPLGKIDALHLAKVNDNPQEETFDVWLAPAYHYLPVKIVRGDPRGLDVSLLVESISTSAPTAQASPVPSTAANVAPVRPAVSATRPSDTTR